MDDQGKPLFRHDLARQMQFTPIELMRQELQRAKQQRWARRRRRIEAIKQRITSFFGFDRWREASAVPHPVSSDDEEEPAFWQQVSVTCRH